MFILDDVDSDRLALPKQYGIHDVPRIVEDKAFNGDCSFKERRPLFASLGPLGDEILVNDTYDAYFETPTSLVRFRLLNSSPARTYDFGFPDGRSFQVIATVIATGGGLLETPVETECVQLSPGERAEIVVRFVPARRRRCAASAPTSAGLLFRAPLRWGRHIRHPSDQGIGAARGIGAAAGHADAQE